MYHGHSYYWVFDENGNVSRIAIYGVMLPKKLESDLKIKENVAKYRLLADHVHDVIWTADENLRLTYVSPSVKNIRGFAPDEILDKPISDLMTAESYETIIRYYKVLIENTQNGKPFPDNLILELELFCNDGSMVWTELIISLIYDDDKKLTGIVGVTWDISLRVKVEEVLKKANRQLSLLSEITRHDILNMISINYVSLSPWRWIAKTRQWFII